jgi:TatA/E family protein of Tat protein translocase
MFGTLGFSELIIILVIVLIIFGAGRLPQIGEGIGKALKGFKKEVNEPLPPMDPNAQQPATGQAPAPVEEAKVVPAAPYQPGPELTPGTTAALMASAAPQRYEPAKPRGTPPPQTAAPAQPDPMSLEQRAANPPPRPQAAYPPVPPAAQTKAPPKRPSAVVNKEAVARVQAQQAALKAKQNAPQGPSPQDMQSLGEGIGDALRTFRQAVADVRGAVDPQMRTIQAEVDAAQKEIEQSIEAAKQMPQVQEDPPPKT